MLAQAITAYQNFENNVAPFALAVLNICLPNATKREVDKIVENNFRGEDDRVLKRDSKYYILMNGSTIEVAERAVNRLKSKFGFISRNFCYLKDTRRIQATAFILGIRRITKSFECKYVDLTTGLNLSNKETHNVKSDFKEYMKCSILRKADNHSDEFIVNIIA